LGDATDGKIGVVRVIVVKEKIFRDSAVALIVFGGHGWIEISDCGLRN
jgi:hypothetical protein